MKLIKLKSCNNIMFKAFTVIEIVIVMALTGIALLMAYSAFLYIGRLTAENNKNQKDVIVISSFMELLKNDFDIAKEIRFDDENSLLVKVNNDENIAYHFHDNYVTRVFIETDTFNFDYKELSFEFMEYNNEYIKKISFIAITDKLKLPVFIHKVYDNSLKYNKDIGK